MELTPQSIHAVEFREAKRKGYNTRDVDDFIERMAAGVAQLHDRVRDAATRAEAAEARMADMQREVEEARRRPMTPEAAETDETLRRTLVLAQRTADATIKEAKEEANRVLSEAREEAARTRAEVEADARRGAEGARRAAEAEVETLIANRDALKADIDVLTRRLGDQRANIRTGINELQRLLDDPNALRQVPTPSLAEVERPLRPEPAGEDLAYGSAYGEAEAADVQAAVPPAPDEPASPFAPGANVAALQEPPVPDLGPPTQPVPFALGNSEARGPWQPSELRPNGDEPLGPLPPPPNGGPVATAPPDRTERPSEWGKAVFDPERADRSTRFGRR